MQLFFQWNTRRISLEMLAPELRQVTHPLMHGQVVQKDAAPETVAAVRESLRRELAVRMKEAASAQALAQARAQAEAHAHSQLEALLAEKAAGMYAPSCNATTEVLHSIACMGYGQAQLCKKRGLGRRCRHCLGSSMYCSRWVIDASAITSSRRACLPALLPADRGSQAIAHSFAESQ